MALVRFNFFTGTRFMSSWMTQMISLAKLLMISETYFRQDSKNDADQTVALILWCITRHELVVGVLTNKLWVLKWTSLAESLCVNAPNKSVNIFYKKSAPKSKLPGRLLLLSPIVKSLLIRCGPTTIVQWITQRTLIVGGKYHCTAAGLRSRLDRTPLFQFSSAV